MDLTLEAYQDLLLATGSDEEYKRLILHRLERNRKNNPLLFTDDFEYAQSIINGIAIHIVRQPNKVFTTTSIIQLQLEKLLSCSEPRKVFNQIVDAIKSNERSFILCIQDIYPLITYTDKNLFNVDFRRALRLDHIQFICSMTHKHYRETIETDAAINSSFTTVTLG